MKFLFRLSLLLGAMSLSGWAETPEAAAYFPAHPGELLQQQLAKYQFSDPALKPWHLKASYQLYESNGKAAKQGAGIFELWWVSPQVYRQSWSRAGATASLWCKTGGKCAYTSSGKSLEDAEYNLPATMLAALPEQTDLDPAKFQFLRHDEKVDGNDFPCVIVAPRMQRFGSAESAPFGLFPAYCFDPQAPVLRMRYGNLGHSTEYAKTIRVQGKFLARQISVYEGEQKVLSATVEAVNGIAATDAALTAPAEARWSADKKIVSAAEAAPALIHREALVYPDDARSQRVEGTVVLRATVDREGRIRALRVLATPTPSLAGVAVLSVAQWKFKPFEQEGVPVEAEVTLDAVFKLDM